MKQYKLSGLALFDFDGTLTTEDSYTKFILFCTPKPRRFIGGLLLSPAILLYKLGWLPACKMRILISAVAFYRRNIQQVQALAQRYVTEVIPHILQPQTMSRMKWHQKQGHHVYVVSASIDPYLSIWCRTMGIQLICSELEKTAKHYTGRYLYGDCGADKVAAITQQIELTRFDTIYAYGDTKEDWPMLALADVGYYQGEKQ